MIQQGQQSERNAGIIRLSQQGIPQSQIAERFGVSSSIVSSVVRKHKSRVAYEKEAVECIRMVKSANDLHERWSLCPLLRVLLITRMANIIIGITGGRRK